MNGESGKSKTTTRGCGIDALLIRLLARGVVLALQNKSAMPSICAGDKAIPVDNPHTSSNSDNKAALVGQNPTRDVLRKKCKILLSDALVDYDVKETEPEEAEAAERVQQFFKTVAGDDMGIDWSELKEVLDLALKREFAFEGFSREVCRSMVAMMDIDRSGKLGLDEFVSLWKSIRTWKSVFKIYDHDNSGHLSSFELRQALTSAGYHVNNKVLESLVLRYGDPQGQVMFDDFIMCAVKLKCMIEIYREKEVAGDRSVNFTLEEWVEKTLYS